MDEPLPTDDEVADMVYALIVVDVEASEMMQSLLDERIKARLKIHKMDRLLALQRAMIHVISR